MKQVYFLFIAALIATITFAQTKEDITDGCLHDDLFNRLIGEWNDTAIAHGSILPHELM